MTYPRIPFEEVINDPRLLKGPWDKLSPPQASALRIFYGLPLDEEGLRHYNMFQGNVEYDELGYVKNLVPATNYSPQEHDEAWIVFGRKSAKTSNFLSWIVAYEVLFGGHTEWRGSGKQEIASFVVAQKLDIAQAIIRDFIEPLISSSKLMEKEIVKSNSDGMVFKSGHRIIPAPPVIKNFRYFSIPVVAMDELAFWYKDAESANPDFEVVRAVTPAQGMFPDRKLIGVSTIWTKEGIIWEAKNAGSYGQNLADDDERKPKFKHALVLVAPTPAMENPLLQRKWFERESKKDPDAYKREYLNQASDSITGMFTEEQLTLATKDAPSKREYLPNHFYVGALDPAFRGDDFTFCIGHYEAEQGFVQDLLKRWSPEGKNKLNPSIILDEISMDLKAFEVQAVYSDQYQLESLQQLALDRGFSMVGMDFTANSKSKLFGSFQQLIRNGRIHLLRNYEQVQQFLFIRRIIGHGGYVRIQGQAGKHDDIVTVTVLCCAMALKFESGSPVEKKSKELTPFDKIMASINAKANVKNDGYL